MPESSISKTTRAKWLLEICEEQVKKYVFNAEVLASLIWLAKPLNLKQQIKVTGGHAVQTTVI